MQHEWVEDRIFPMGFCIRDYSVRTHARVANEPSANVQVKLIINIMVNHIHVKIWEITSLIILRWIFFDGGFSLLI